MKISNKVQINAKGNNYGHFIIQTSNEKNIDIFEDSNF